jgi:hypothetical protein
MDADFEAGITDFEIRDHPRTSVALLVLLRDVRVLRGEFECD